ncbi:MAG TPA: sulfotransferase domain-containing protein [Beijerinckiaceae bacterium]|jgi:hypothetical protein
MITWLASYPRSGNTLLRMLLRQVFGIRTLDLHQTPMSPRALRHAKRDYGHLQHRLTPERLYSLAKDKPRRYFIKTHEPPLDGSPAIYVVRDGRSATVSYFHYLKTVPGPPASLEDTVLGRVHLGSWSEHLEAWDPENRPDTLLLHYQDVVRGDEDVIRKISAFLGLEPLAPTFVHDFSELNRRDPYFFRSGSDEANIEELRGTAAELFWALHGPTMARYDFARPPHQPVPGLREAFLQVKQELAAERTRAGELNADRDARLQAISDQQEQLRRCGLQIREFEQRFERQERDFRKALQEVNADRDARLQAISDQQEQLRRCGLQIREFEERFERQARDFERALQEVNADRDARLQVISDQQEQLRRCDLQIREFEERFERQAGDFQSALQEVNDDRDARLEALTRQAEAIGKLEALLREYQAQLEAANADREDRLKAIVEQQDTILKLQQLLDECNTDREARLKTIVRQQETIARLEQELAGRSAAD